MKTVNLNQIEHEVKIGKQCPYTKPNITEDCLLKLNDDIIGFYIKDIAKYNEKLKSLLLIANNEFNSDNVPKQIMSRGPQGTKKDKLKRKIQGDELVTQYSTILGSVPPNARMRRNYKNISSVHRHKKAKVFIKAMFAACLEAEQIIKKLTPDIYKKQQNIFTQINKKWKFGTMYTSSISNYNISAPYHRDTANIKDTVNVILTKRNNADGGCLNVPDFDVTFEQANNSMLVYPAWKNVHGVTPIVKHKENGYRNSFIFYPLNAFTENEQN